MRVSSLFAFRKLVEEPGGMLIVVGFSVLEIIESHKRALMRKSGDFV